ncbi:DUF4177 domain-containing protein [Puniceibacterium confluentis]|uniref:DUF4177 domain-containing protein n=1 Tax=Puniceibacterium confluentis TaxID=1958944 RepID=UPI00319E1976
MNNFEYKVIPAPARGEKGKGVKGPEARFAHALELVMNEMAADGWEYQRAETLPSSERSGLTGSVTQWRNLLVFRRPRDADVAAHQPRLLDAPVSSSAVEEDVSERPVPRSAGLGAAGLRLGQPRVPPGASQHDPDQTADTVAAVPSSGKSSGAPEPETHTGSNGSGTVTPAEAEASGDGFSGPPATPDNEDGKTAELSHLTSALRARAARLQPVTDKDPADGNS